MQLSDVSNYHIIVIRGLLNREYVFQSSDRVAMTMLDFADQATLATLYQYCDIAITRAGTTSLAEQKLRDMKLCMIPLPWTHDQLTNARYYVQEYGDDLIVQDDDLVQSLVGYLASHTNYHKSLTDKDRATLITLPKSIVLHTLLSSN